MRKVFKIVQFIMQHPLAGKHKLYAIRRFLGWQLSQFFSPRMIQHSFVGTTKFWTRKGMEAATANIYTGLHEFEEMGFLLHFLKPEDTFIDVGANIGSYTILASGVIGSRTICLEPVPATFALLQENITLNGIEDKVLALNIGAAAGESEMFFTDDKSSSNHVLINPGQSVSCIKVPVNSLDNVLENEQAPSLIKIDVEGFEQEVINGADKTLGNENLKAIIIELIGGGKRFGFDEGKIHQQLLKYNFLPYQYLPFDRSLINTNTQTNNNTLYLRDIEFIKDRINLAKPISVFSEIF